MGYIVRLERKIPTVTDMLTVYENLAHFHTRPGATDYARRVQPTTGNRVTIVRYRYYWIDSIINAFNECKYRLAANHLRHLIRKRDRLNQQIAKRRRKRGA